MDLGLNGKVAIVAASSGGLGRATALTLAREGAVVTVNGRDAGSLARTAAEIRAETDGNVLEVVADLRDPDAADRLVAETVAARGRLDIVVCNAGGPPAGTFSDVANKGDGVWLDAIELNLMSTIRLCRAALPHLEASGGSITNIVSISVKQPIPHLVLSNTARTAVIGFAKSLAGEFAPKGVRVNNVLPGSILTNRVRSIAAPKAAASGNMRTPYTAAGTANCTLFRRLTAMVIANVLLWMPISMELAIA